MTSFADDIQRIKEASSLEDIQRTVRHYSAEAPAGQHGGVLYSGRVGATKSEVIALEVAEATGQPIVNETPRAQFLSAAEREITESAIHIYRQQGQSRLLAEQSANSFLYGDANAPIHSPISLDGCLWGETSREFAGSLHGDVTLIASQAQNGRVFAVAEIPAALENGGITAIGGYSTDALRTLARHGETGEVLTQTQRRFIDAAPHGIFVSPRNIGPEISKVVISKEVAAALGLDTAPFSSTADLTSAGLQRVPLTPFAPQKGLGITALQSTRPSAMQAPNTSGVADAEAAARGLRSIAAKSLGAGSAVLMALDAYTTTEQYQALSTHNGFGADALLRHYEGRTAGGLLGGLAAGAAYGAAFGAETGPGAFVTGAVGGVIGAFAGDKIATMVTEHKVNHQTGSDGVDYAYAQGLWTHTHYRLDPAGPAVPNPHGIGAMTRVVTPAPAEQLAQLEYRRMTAITALALANPAAQDTRHITLDGTRWQKTAAGWAQPVDIASVPHLYGIPSTVTVDRPADEETARQLEQIAANRQFNNDHYAEDVAKAYVMDYVGNGWAAHGPLPEAVTNALHLPSEEHIRDPLTGQRWTADGANRFSREEVQTVGRVVIGDTVQARGDEQVRLEQQRQTTVAGNAHYGRQLIAQAFEHAAHREAIRAEPGRAADNDDPAHARPITPSSSNREMFDALVSAAQHLDLAGMREVGQAYMQSERGQAWLAQGQQLNQQLAQQQAALAATQQAPALQGLAR